MGITMKIKLTNDNGIVVQTVHYLELTITAEVADKEFNIVIGYNDKDDRNQFDYFRFNKHTYDTEEDLSDAVGDYLLQELEIDTEVAKEIDDVVQQVDKKIIEVMEEFEIDRD
jgi:hypothetical protein